ncbi:MAG: substrate-binding domain-containing protein [Rickettsiaceae bacterium H1]|nr:substrate-binding domain-containing protein [Rickettsiaceae bacterium H1]
MKFLIKMLVLVLISCKLSAKNFSDINLLIDDNLAEPVRKLVRKYVEENYVSVAVQLSGYKELLNLNNEDTDIIITADEETANFLQDKDLIEKKILDFASDQLVLVSGYDVKYKNFGDLAKSLQKLSKYSSIVITDPKISLSGYLAYGLLKPLGIDNVVRVRDESKAVHLMKTGKGFGLLLTGNKMDLTIISPVPADLCKPVKYQVLALKNRLSENVTSFLKFLLLNRSILKEDYGMIVGG